MVTLPESSSSWSGVGVDDLVLLDDYKSEDAFINNLKIRYAANHIYTYIGPVLITVNPYKQLPHMYDAAKMHAYRNAALFELPPHIFAIADNACRNMVRETRDECILISGESGAGKTEASKYILEHIARALIPENNVQANSKSSGHSTSSNSGGSSSGMAQLANAIKDKLITCNYVLEAFGNATTLRNNNSSRFGKYMDVRFDFRGQPCGGRILNYLLEESRLIKQARNERNFHVFYELLAGGEASMLEQELDLVRGCDTYALLNGGVAGGGEMPIDASDLEADRANFALMHDALATCDFTSADRLSLYRVISALLHLGNFQFESVNGTGRLQLVADQPCLNSFCKMLELDKQAVIKSMLNRKFYVARSEQVDSPLSYEQAVYARNALVKDIYQRTFNWIIQMINASLGNMNEAVKTSAQSLGGNCVGILDIYGFEVFEKNGFDQFCINYCNEKLHELFTELTLRSEQEDYVNEAIAWEHIEFVHNRAICELIEAKPVSIIDILDEECARPGEISDMLFLKKLATHFSSHANFESASSSRQSWRAIPSNAFQIKHYAGNVLYTVDEFVDKNNNLLFKNFKELMSTSQHPIIRAIYVDSNNSADTNSTRKSETVASHFRTGLKKLMAILYQKEPSYVRCIKPNHSKMPSLFDAELVRHQVKYLSLLENLRIRRAGHAYKKPYDKFVQRYKSLCVSTWPSYGAMRERDAARLILTAIGCVVDVDFSLGRTKIFVRTSRTFFELERRLAARKHELVSKIKALYKGQKQQRIYKRTLRAGLIMIRFAKQWVRRRQASRRRQAFRVLRKFFVAFANRSEAINDTNRVFVRMMYARYLNELADNLRTRGQKQWHRGGINWPTCGKHLQQISDMLRRIYEKNLLRKFCLQFTPEKKEIMREKLVASELFKDRKDSYANSVSVPFVDDRLSGTEPFKSMAKAKQSIVIQQKKYMNGGDEKLIYSTLVEKYDRHGYKKRPRIVILTDKFVYGLDVETLKLRDNIALSRIDGIRLSKFADGFIVLRLKKAPNTTTTTNSNGNKQAYEKGDLILCDSLHHIEFLTKLMQALNKTDDKDFLQVAQNTNDYCLEHLLANGNVRSIKYTKAVSENNIAKLNAQAIRLDKKGNLILV